MQLKYKVFFNDSMLVLCSPEHAPEGLCRERIGKPDRALMLEMVEEFEKSGVSAYCVCTENPEALFGIFKSLFKVIEASGGLVRDRQGRYLFIRRYGRWDIPKGKIESGESPDDAAVREVMEECGIGRPEIVKKVPSTYHTYQLDGRRVLKITNWFLMNYEGDTQTTPQVEEGITDVVWLKPSQFDIILDNTYRSLSDLLGEIDWE